MTRTPRSQTQPSPRFVRTCTLIAVGLAALFLAGCVERRMVIVSEPAGAQVFWDGFEAGVTPTVIEFHHYGTHELILRHEGTGSGSSAETYATHRELVEVETPWYQWFPIDLLAEFWPGGIVDEHRVEVTLDRSQPDRDVDPFEARAREQGVFEEDAGAEAKARSEDGAEGS